MAHASFNRRPRRFLALPQIDGPKFGGLAWIGMSHANQVHKGSGRPDLRGIAFGSQCIAPNWFAPGCQFCLRARPNQRPHAVSPAQ